jgi:hypothetical protein
MKTVGFCRDSVCGLSDTSDLVRELGSAGLISSFPHFHVNDSRRICSALRDRVDSIIVQGSLGEILPLKGLRVDGRVYISDASEIVFADLSSELRTLASQEASREKISDSAYRLLLGVYATERACNFHNLISFEEGYVVSPFQPAA